MEIFEPEGRHLRSLLRCTSAMLESLSWSSRDARAASSIAVLSRFFGLMHTIRVKPSPSHHPLLLRRDLH